MEWPDERRAPTRSPGSAAQQPAAQEPAVLWRPDPENGPRVARRRVHAVAARAPVAWTSDELDYPGLHDWSVRDLDGFWSAVAEHLGVIFHEPPAATLGRREMPGTQWFPGLDAQLRGARPHARSRPRGRRRRRRVAVVEDGTEKVVTHAELRDLVARARAGLGGRGGPGDRVVAMVPNSVETLVAFLATASLGAVWSSCSPDFGARAVLDRFAQIEPTVLVAVDGYRYNGRAFDVARARGRPAEGVADAEGHGAGAAPRPRCHAGRHGGRGRSSPPRRPAGVHTGALRPPAVGAVLVGDDRAAQGHRAGRTAGSSVEHLKALRAALRPRPGRPVPLVHHDRLDDVELPGRRPAGRARRWCSTTAARAIPTSDVLWRARRAPRGSVFGVAAP